MLTPAWGWRRRFRHKTLKPQTRVPVTRQVNKKKSRQPTMWSVYVDFKLLRIHCNNDKVEYVETGYIRVCHTTTHTHNHQFPSLPRGEVEEGGSDLHIHLCTCKPSYIYIDPPGPSSFVLPLPPIQFLAKILVCVLGGTHLFSFKPICLT